MRVPALLALLALAACGDGQPFFDENGEGSADVDTDGDGLSDDVDEDDDGNGIRDVDEDIDGDGVADGDDGDDDGDGIPDQDDPDADGDGVPDDEQGGGVEGPDLPPGTETPTPENGIFRYEADDGQGGGFVRDVAYDRATDTFEVDNLAFDGANVYTRDDDLPTLGTRGTPAVYAVYEAAEVEFDDDGDPIDQLDYKAIYGVSGTTVAGPGGAREPRTQFAIVRTGSFVDYGFGGFVYERNGGVELPTTGQATYSGDYAGLRVFDGRGGLEVTQGDVDVAIDFRDFNDGSGVRGVISNRQAFEADGTAIPLGGDGELVLPPLTFEVGPGVVTADGEISAGLNSYTEGEGGALEAYESGTYYAIVAGESAGEIVGVFVVTSQDPRFEGVTAQETGGFIVYR